MRAPIVMSEAEYEQQADEYIGMCIYCHEANEQIEPDAEAYECEYCERPGVYGLENLMIMGMIRIEN